MCSAAGIASLNTPFRCLRNDETLTSRNHEFFHLLVGMACNAKRLRFLRIPVWWAAPHHRFQIVRPANSVRQAGKSDSFGGGTIIARKCQSRETSLIFNWPSLLI
jgi:hypothetical protein